MNDTAILKLKAWWPSVIQALNTGGKAHFVFSTNGWDAVKQPDRLPYLLSNTTPLDKTSITKLDPRAEVTKVAFGTLEKDLTGGFTFNIDKASTLKAATSVRTGIKHFATVAADSQGPLKSLASLQGLAKLKQPKTQVGSSTLEVKGLKTDTDLAGSGGKKSYVKKQQKGTKTDDQIARGSTFNTMLVGLKSWHSTYNDKLTRENVDQAEVDLTEIAKLASEWEKSHKKDWFNKDRKKAVSEVIERLKLLKQEITDARKRWAEADRAFEESVVIDKALGVDEPDPKRRLEACKKAEVMLAQHLKQDDLDPDEREALEQEQSKLKRAHREVLTQLQEQNGDDWGVLAAKWNLRKRKPDPEKERKLTEKTKELLAPVPELVEDLKEALVGGKPKGSYDAAIKRADTLSMDVLAMVSTAKLSKEVTGKPIEALEGLLKALEPADNPLFKTDPDDLKKLADCRARIRERLRATASHLTRLLIEDTSSGKHDESWVTALGRENSAVSQTRALVCRYEGKEFANTLLETASQKLSEVGMKSVSRLELPPIVKNDMIGAKLDAAYEQLVMKQLTALNMEPPIPQDKVKEALKTLLPDLTDMQKVDSHSYPSVGKAVARVLELNQDYLEEFMKSSYHKITDWKRTPHLDYSDVRPVIIKRVKMGLPVDLPSIIRALPEKYRGSDDTLDERMELKGLLDPEVAKLEKKAGETLVTYQKQTHELMEQHTLENAEMYSAASEIFKAVLDPLLNPGKVTAIPQPIRKLCQETVDTCEEQGATGDRRYALVADILLLRWLNPILNFYGGKYDTDKKRSASRMGTFVASLLQNVANGTLPREYETQALVPLVKEYTLKFKTFTEAMIKATRLEEVPDLTFPTYTMGDLSSANPILWYDTSTDPYQYLVSSMRQDLPWARITAFCSLLSVKWLQRPRMQFGFSMLSTGAQQEYAAELATFGGKGKKAQVQYAQGRLGGKVMDWSTLNSQLDKLPDGTKIWCANSEHVVAAIVKGDEVLYYDPNVGSAKKHDIGMFQAFMASDSYNEFVVV